MISGKTKLAALIGSPVAHSVSPGMHNAAFNKLGIDCVYLCFDICDNELETAVNAMRAFNVLGFNVTMPHKKSVIPYLDEITADAALIGAVNTVENKSGRLIGHNTDGAGFIKSLEAAGVICNEKKIAICGAGGAGRAIAIALAQACAGEIVIFDIMKDAAADLAKTINENTDTKAVSCEYDEVKLTETAARSHIFINATGLGMHPREDEAVVNGASAFYKGQVAADVIYNPSPTIFLKNAAAAGAITVDGSGMVYHQGALAFKIWTGQEMP